MDQKHILIQIWACRWLDHNKDPNVDTRPSSHNHIVHHRQLSCFHTFWAPTGVIKTFFFFFFFFLIVVSQVYIYLCTKRRKKFRENLFSPRSVCSTDTYHCLPSKHPRNPICCIRRICRVGRFPNRQWTWPWCSRANLDRSNPLLRKQQILN